MKMALVIKALQAVTGNISLNSCDDTSAAFEMMFSGSKIIQRLSIGKHMFLFLIMDSPHPCIMF